METAHNYRGEAESRIGTGPLGFVVLECFCDVYKRIGKVEGQKLNKQWLFHPNGLTVHKFHFFCTGAAEDDSVLNRMVMDADESTSQLTSKKRRTMANLLRRAQELVHHANIKVADPKPRRLPKTGLVGSSLGMNLKKKILKDRRQRRRANAKARASQQPIVGNGP